jgi:hypothetical protein
MTQPGVDDSTDLEYRTAIEMSVSDQTMAELRRLGYDDEIESYGAQGYCPELDR